MMYIGSVSSFVEFGDQTSMTFERFALKRPRVSRHVSLSFTSSIWMILILEVLKSYTIMFGLETSEKTSPRTIQGFLRKDQKLVSRLPKTDQTTEAVDAQWVNQCPVSWVSSFET